MSDLAGFYTLENADSLAEAVRQGMTVTPQGVRAIISAASAELDKRDHQIEHLTAIIEQFVLCGAAIAPVAQRAAAADHFPVIKKMVPDHSGDSTEMLAPDDIDPCGGCGESDPDKRCLGCMHPFNVIKPAHPGAPAATSPGAQA